MRKILLALVSILVIGQFSAQMDVDNTTMTVSELIQNVLIGEGIDVSGIMINGMLGDDVHVQAGSFTDGNSDIGLDYGVIMGTGNVNMAEQLNTGDGSSLPSAGDGYSFAPLEDLITVSVNDQVIIEFDFIPQGDTLTFNYVFASEEYPEYVCGGVNDVFGFFISGSNPAGGTYVNENIALIPDPSDPSNYTNTPVSINTLNPGTPGSSANNDPTNCDNADPEWASYSVFYTPNTSNSYEYDGSTVVLTARAVVNCGEQYHIALGIGDGGDTQFDSGVFLEAGSFSAEPSGLTTESLFPLGLVEISSNCDEGVGRIGRNCASDTAYYQLNYLVNDSTATYGVDYEPLPTEMMLIFGQTDSIFPIVTIADGIAEPTEYICIELLEAPHPDSAYLAIDTACVPIIDNYTFDVTAEEQVMWCPEHVPALNAVPQFPGVAPFEYEWVLNGTIESTDNPYLAPVPPNYGDSIYYSLNAVDYCGAVNNPTSVLVANRVRSYPETNGITVTGDYCPGIPYRLRVQFDGGTYPLEYVWEDNQGNLTTYEDSHTIFVDPVETYNQLDQIEYSVHFMDACNPRRVSDTSTFVLTFPEIIDVNTQMNQVICVDQELDLNVTTAGGYPPFNYQWSAEPGLAPGPGHPIDGFTISQTDGEGFAYGFYTIEGQTENPFDIILEVEDWCSEQLDASMITNYYNPSVLTTSNYELNAQTDSSVVYQTVEALNCIFPNVVSPNGDGLNDNFVVNELINRPGTMFIYNRWGNLLAETSRHEWITGDTPSGTYFYVVKFDDGDDFKGNFTIVK